MRLAPNEPPPLSKTTEQRVICLLFVLVLVVWCYMFMRFVVPFYCDFVLLVVRHCVGRGERSEGWQI